MCARLQLTIRVDVRHAARRSRVYAAVSGEWHTRDALADACRQTLTPAHKHTE